MRQVAIPLHRDLGNGALDLAAIVCCQLDLSRSDVLRLQRGGWLLPGREIRGSGELSLRLEAGDPFAQRR
jgi:hypothetical protein